MSALLFGAREQARPQHRGAFLHIPPSRGVGRGGDFGLLVLQTGGLWLDAATSMVIVAVILVGTWGLLRRSVNMAIDRVPRTYPAADVVAALEGLPG